jgi:hypothetical protein
MQLVFDAILFIGLWVYLGPEILDRIRATQLKTYQMVYLILSGVCFLSAIFGVCQIVNLLAYAAYP